MWRGSEPRRCCPTEGAPAGDGASTGKRSTPSCGSSGPRSALARPARKVQPLLADLLYDRFVRWRRDGTWDGLLAHVQTKSDAVGEVERAVSVDSSVAPRAHQHAAGARKWPSSLEDANRGLAPQGRRGARAEPGRAEDQAAPRLRRQQGSPAPGGRADARPASRGHPAGAGTRRDPGGVPRPRTGPRKRPDRLLADRGYSYPRCRGLLSSRGIPHAIPERKDHRERRRGRRSSTARPTGGATWWRGAWAGSSSSGGASPRATRSGRPATGRW
jgi:hypothetical protein